MITRTIVSEQPGAIVLNLDVDHGEITVTVEDRQHAEITLTPLHPADPVAADLITRTTVTQQGQTCTVTMPSAPMPIQQANGNAVVGQVFGDVRGVVIGAVIGTHAGRITTGSSTATLFTGGQVRAEVRLPAGSSVSVSTVSADLSAAGELDVLRYQSMSGRLDATTVAELDASTVSGSVTVWNASRAGVSTVSGAVELETTSNATIETVSGRIHLDSLNGRARAKSVSGDITVHATGASTVDASTVSGDIHLTAQLGVTVQARTHSVSGRITRDF
ncbi:DUF4097 family beta strand repeat-containing protein [Crossiella sp. CA198]|uniref:DUF4097 family beta strand repeat-containing protein n=1 Tax=Crossiella sp. CA198 TaxID=3455607 RepID=UPI003F8D34C7